MCCNEILIFADDTTLLASGLDPAEISAQLNNRKQCAVIDGEKSALQSINAGVRQGSRLGPLLFIIFINDIINDIESEILIFADDTTLLASGLDPAEPY